MRKFQRAVVVSAVVAGLSVLGAGVGFADDGDATKEGGVVAFPVHTAEKGEVTTPAPKETFKYEIDLSSFFAPFVTK